MNRLNWHRKLMVLVSFTMMIGVLGFIDIATAVGKPFGGYISFYSIYGQHWQMSPITPTNWLSENNIPLTFDDTISEVNGQNARSYFFPMDKIFADAYTAGKPVVLTTQNGIKEIPVTTFSIHQLWAIKATDWIIGICFLLLAFTILYSDSNPTYSGRIIVLICCAIAANRFAINTALYNPIGPFNYINDLVGILIALPLISTFLLHGSLYFPEKIGYLQRWPKAEIVAIILYIPPVLIIAIYICSRLLLWLHIETAIQIQLDEFAFKSIGKLHNTYGVLFTFNYLYHEFSNIYHKKALPFHMISIIILMATAGASFYLNISYINSQVPGINIPVNQDIDFRLLSLLIPIVLGFIILKYQTFKGVNWSFVFIPVIGISAMMAEIIIYLRPKIIAQYPITLFIFFFLILMANAGFWLLLPRLTNLGRLFGTEQSNFQDVKNFINAIDAIETDQLAKQLAIIYREQLSVEKIAIWQKKQLVFDRFSLVAQAGHWHSSLPSQISQATIPTDIQQPIRVEDIPNQFQFELDPQDGVELFIPTWVDGKLIGFTLLGKRNMIEIANKPYLETLTEINQFIQLYYSVLQSISYIKTVPDQLQQAQKEERLQLALDIHDNVDSLLLKLGKKLATLTSTYQNDNIEPEIFTDLEKVKDDLVHELKLLHQELRIPQDISLPLKLNEIAEEYLLNYNYLVCPPTDFSFIEQLSNKQEALLWRIIKQALDNVFAHASKEEGQKSQPFATAHIDVTMKDNHIHFTIEDDGLGFDEEKVMSEERAFHSFNDNIRAIFGKIKVTSSPGKGTLVKGSFPLERGKRE